MSYELRVPDLATLTRRIIDDHPAGGVWASRPSNDPLELASVAGELE